MAHNILASENISVVSSFMQQYKTQDIIYDRKALNAFKELYEQILPEYKIPHATESRLKEPASLEDKLVKLERKRGLLYQTTEEINQDIFNLAGVRILVHIPSTRTKASRLLHDAFVVKRMFNHPKRDEAKEGLYEPEDRKLSSYSNISFSS